MLNYNPLKCECFHWARTYNQEDLKNNKHHPNCPISMAEYWSSNGEEFDCDGVEEASSILISSYGWEDQNITVYGGNKKDKGELTEDDKDYMEEMGWDFLIDNVIEVQIDVEDVFEWEW